TAPAARVGETEEEAHAASVGCESCHTASDAPSMHKSSAVVLGCVDCHGGDAAVTVASPPWQSTQPSTTAEDLCIEGASEAVWQLSQPTLFVCASASLSPAGAGA